MLGRFFPKHHDHDFLQALHSAMQEALLDYQKIAPSFSVVNQKEIEILYKPQTHQSINAYLHALQVVRNIVATCITNNTEQPEALSRRVELLAVVDDVLANIADNQAKIATAKVALTHMVKEFPDLNHYFDTVLKFKTLDIALFSAKVERLQSEVGVVTNKERTEGKDVSRLEDLETRLKEVISQLPAKSINMHHLNKEEFERDRRVGKG